MATGTTPNWGTNDGNGLFSNDGAPTTIVLENTIGNGWTANLAVTQPPTYPSTIKSLGPIKLTSDSNTITLGTDGVLSIPNSIQFPDDKVQTTAYIPKYKVFTALLTQSGGYVPNGQYQGLSTNKL